MKAFLAVVLLAAAVTAENLCPVEQETDWEIELLLPHEDCNKFYKCTFGQPVEQSCFGDLYFNLDNWQCDFPENVECGTRNDPAVDKDEESPPEPEVVEPEPEVVEPEPEVVEPEPEVVEPEPEVIEPEPEVIEPEPEVIEPEPEVVEPEQEEDDSEEESDDVIVAVPIIPDEPVVEESEAEENAPEPEEENEDCVEEAEQNPEIEFLENGCPVDPHIHWLLPHESDCNLFYYCVWGQKELRNCSGSLHFNPKLQVCDWPLDAGCAVSANKHYGARAMYFR